MAVAIQLRRGLSTLWTSVDPILAEGEVGLETDTGFRKTGDGITIWSLLSYDATGGGGTDDQTATEVPFTPAGGVAATNVQAAIVEVAGDQTTTAAALVAHVSDTSDAHDASAISFTPVGTIAATDVQAAIAELLAEGGGTDDQTAAEVPFTPAGSIAATNVQAALVELDSEKATTGSVTTVQSNLDAHTADTSDAHDASAISVVPTGGIVSTTVQAALAELDSDLTAATGHVVRRFAGRNAILLLGSGQSNQLQTKVATTPTPNHARVHFLAAKNRAVASPQSTTFTTANFEWISPSTSDPIILDLSSAGPNPYSAHAYVGHMLGGTGNSLQQLAYDIAVAEPNVEVYCINISWGGANLAQWDPSTGPVYDLLSQIPYWITNTPALAAEGITRPDITQWRQGETDATLGYTAKQYNTEHTTMRTSAASSWDGTNTVWLLGEPTQYFNETGPSAYHFEGTNAVARYGGEKFIPVSSIGIAYDVADQIHFTGDGNIAYGHRMYQALYGLLPAALPTSTEFGRDRNPKATGNLNMDSHNISNVVTLGATTGNITTVNATTGNITTVNATALGVTGTSTLADITASTGMLTSTVPVSGSARGFIFDTDTDYDTDNDHILDFRTLGTTRAYLTGIGRLHGRVMSARTFSTDYASFAPVNDLALIAYFGTNMTVNGFIGTNSGEHLSGVASGASNISYFYNTTANMSTAGHLLVKRSNFGVQKYSLSKDGDGVFAGNLTAVNGTFTGPLTTAAQTASGLITASAGLTGTILTATTRVNTPLYYSTVAEASGAFQHKFDSSGAAWSTENTIGIFNGTANTLNISWDGKIVNTSGNVSISKGVRFVPNPAVPAEYFELSDFSANNIGTVKWWGTAGMTLNSEVADGGVAHRLRPGTTALTSGTLLAVSNGTSSANRMTVSFDGVVLAKALSNSVVTVSGTTGTFVTGSGSTAVLNGTVVSSNVAATTITLPDATAYPGVQLRVKNATAKTLTLNSVSSQTFDGVGGSPSVTGAGDIIWVQSDGSNWLRLKVGAF